MKFSVNVKIKNTVLCFLLTTILPAAAQENMSSYLSKINENSKRIESSRTKWKESSIRQPEASLYVEKIIAKSEDNLRLKGASEERIKKVEKAAREEISSLMSGSEQTTLLTCVLHRETFLCEVISSPPVPIGSPSANLDSYAINYYNGKDSIAVNREILKANQSAKNALWLGNFMRGGQEIMPNVGLKNLSFLTGASKFEEISSGFKFFNESNEFLVLEKTKKEPVPGKIRITFSKKIWRPVLEEFINSANNKIIYSIESTGYRSYVDGVSFPSKVVTKSFRGNGALGSKETYELVSAEFNALADVSCLQKPLPIGAIINDYRFAPRPGARYKIRKGGIPSDATVLKLVEEREANDLSGKRQQQVSTARNIALPIGTLLMVGGLVWFRRSRRDKA